MEHGRTTVAGITLALVGFSSSFAVVLQGLRAVGATPGQAASGLVALLITQALGMLALAYRYRMPLTLAWSTPGAALLVTTRAVSGGWAAAVGAFAVVGVLMVVTALWPRLGRLVAAIPAPVAQAMLAGVLFGLCLAPVRAVVSDPAFVIPLIALWAVTVRWRPAWSSPLVFTLALVIIVARNDWATTTASALLPKIQLTAPHFSAAAVIGLALPLYLVTMASQNVPGAAVMASYGYKVPWRSSLTVTGLGTILASFAGGHAVNLAAITAALGAGPEAHPDPARRWRASTAAAWTYLVLALLAPALAILAARSQPALLASVAGLALLGTFGTAVAGATADPPGRLPAVVTFVIAASDTTIFRIGAPFWALAGGCLCWLLFRRGTKAGAQSEGREPAPTASGAVTSPSP